MRRASSASAFLVACVGIAFFSCMDAIMKHVSIAIGAYNAMLWRSMIGVALSAPLFFGGGLRWPDRGRLLLHVKRSGAAGISVLLFFWGLVRVPMAEGIALSFLSPIIALLLAAPMLGKERCSPSGGASAERQRGFTSAEPAGFNPLRPFRATSP